MLQRVTRCFRVSRKAVGIAWRDRAEAAPLGEIMLLVAWLIFLVWVVVMMTGCATTGTRLERYDSRVLASCEAHGWSEADCALLRQGKVRNGMTRLQVETAWGPPRSVNVSTYGHSQRVQLVWATPPFGDPPYTFAYFENGLLVATQTPGY